MKTIKYEGNLTLINQLLDKTATNSDFKLICSYAGGLLDNYLFENINYSNGSGIVLGKTRKARKYIICKEVYVNEWSSTYEVSETDSEKSANDFIKVADEDEQAM